MKKSFRRKSRSRKNKRISQAEVYVTAWLIAFFILLFAILGLRSCIANKKSNLRESDFIPHFTDTRKVTVYNHITKMISTVSLNEYLFHVVAAEIPASYDIEALKAQAVSARTYTVQKSTSILGESAKQCNAGKWDICTDSSCCQSWKSLVDLKERWGHDYNEYAHKVYDAVIQTEDEIAVYNNRPINAMYHSTSGGYTANIEDIYGGDSVPYLRGVKSSGEENSSGYRSVVKLKKAEAVKILNREFGQNLTKQNISDRFKVSEKNENGFVKKASIGTKKVTGRDIRRVFSLKSSNFSIDFDSNYVIIRVKGYGHGVGMSQSGAGAMARNGSDYKEILTHYYTGIRIKKIGDVL